MDARPSTVFLSSGTVQLNTDSEATNPHFYSKVDQGNFLDRFELSRSPKMNQFGLNASAFKAPCER